VKRKEDQRVSIVRTGKEGELRSRKRKVAAAIGDKGDSQGVLEKPFRSHAQAGRMNRSTQEEIKRATGPAISIIYVIANDTKKGRSQE